MERIARLAICAAVIAVLSLSLAGCGGASTDGETSTPSTPAESPAATTEEAAPAEFPPAPADVSGMSGWFEEAYPDAAWRTRIKSIEYVAGEVPDSGGFANAIVVTTDLDFAAEQPVGQEIVTALGEAHPGWAKQYVVRFGDGKNIMAGDIVDMTP